MPPAVVLWRLVASIRRQLTGNQRAIRQIHTSTHSLHIVKQVRAESGIGLDVSQAVREPPVRSQKDHSLRCRGDRPLE